MWRLRTCVEVADAVGRNPQSQMKRARELALKERRERKREKKAEREATRLASTDEPAESPDAAEDGADPDGATPESDESAR